MKILSAISCLTLLSLTGCWDRSEETKKPAPELFVYAYDTLLSEGGWGRAVFPRFEKTCGCKLTLVSVGDAGQLVSRLQMDQASGKVRAHVALGVDQYTARVIRDHIESWESWRPKGWEDLIQSFQVMEPHFLPFDYGSFSFIADRQVFEKKGIPFPVVLSFADLNTEPYRRAILLQDPRVSAPGFVFVAYTQVKLKNRFEEFWKKFRTQWLTLTPGWDSAYALFLKGEAPLVWSYTTSQAYHRAKGDVSRYQAIPLATGAPAQVEGAVLLKGSPEEGRDAAKKFLEFLISEGAQAKIPETNWMFPVRGGIPVPSSFKDLPMPAALDWGEGITKPSELLKRWEAAIRS